MSKENKNMVLVIGKPSGGKSAALRNLPNPEKVVYLNADIKQTPFKNNFLKDINIVNPLHILNFLDNIESNPDVAIVALDTLTMLMEAFTREFITNPNVTDTMKGWLQYGDFYRDIITRMKASSKDFAVLSHQATKYNEEDMVMDVSVPLSGAVGKRGVEADFTTIVAAKRMLLDDLVGFENDLLTITDEEKEDGFKYVFMTRVDANTLNEKMRSALGIWSRKEKYINNDLSLVFNRLHEYYT